MTTRWIDQPTGPRAGRRRRVTAGPAERVSRERGKARADVEHHEQAFVIRWCWMTYGQYDRAAGRNLIYPLHPEEGLIYSIPNGGKRSKATAGKMKAEGLRKSWPDLALDWPVDLYHGLRIELKAPRHLGGKCPKPEQRTTHNLLRAARYAVAVCYGGEAAIEAIKSYMNGTFKPEDYER